jgi:DNA-binding ferritin-like protein
MDFDIDADLDGIPLSFSEEGGQWTTMNGAHILLKDGESREEGSKRFLAGKNKGVDEDAKSLNESVKKAASNQPKQIGVFDHKSVSEQAGKESKEALRAGNFSKYEKLSALERKAKDYGLQQKMLETMDEKHPDHAKLKEANEKQRGEVEKRMKYLSDHKAAATENKSTATEHKEHEKSEKKEPKQKAAGGGSRSSSSSGKKKQKTFKSKIVSDKKMMKIGQNLVLSGEFTSTEDGEFVLFPNHQAPALELGDKITADGKPVQRFRKEIIRCGQFTKQRDGIAFEVTPKSLDHWVATFNQMNQDGIKVYFPEGHTNQAGKNRGYWQKLEVAPSSYDPDKQALYGEVEVAGDDGIGLIGRSDVSLYAPPKLVAGNGKEYIRPIVHIAACTDPVIPGLGEWESVAASLTQVDENLSLANEEKAMATTEVQAIMQDLHIGDEIEGKRKPWNRKDDPRTEEELKFDGVVQSVTTRPGQFDVGAITTVVYKNADDEIGTVSNWESLTSFGKKTLHEIKLADENSDSAPLLDILAILTAQRQNYHIAHWTSSGSDFPEYHVLFGDFYDELTDEIDSIGEKIVGQFGSEAIDSSELTQAVQEYLEEWNDVDSSIERGLESEKELQGAIETALEDTTPGIENLLQSIADAHEKNQYKLQQCQSDVEASLSLSESESAMNPVFELSSNPIPQGTEMNVANICTRLGIPLDTINAENAEEMILGGINELEEGLKKNALVLSNEPKATDPAVVRLVHENRTMKLNNLIQGGNITPAVAGELNKVFNDPNSLELSLSQGDDRFDDVVKILAHNDTVSLREKTGAQTTVKLSSEVEEKDEENPLLKNAEKLCKEAEDRDKTIKNNR